MNLTATYPATEYTVDQPDTAREHLLATIPVEERKIQLAGIPTTFLEGGEGPPVILLHSPGETSIWWMRTVPELIKNHHLILPDLPGQGESKKEVNPDQAHLLKWLNALIEQTCSTSPVLVGHIGGGAIAARYAISNAIRLRHLVLVDSTGLASFRPSPKFAFGLMKFLAKPSERNYNGFLSECLFDVDKLKREMGSEWKPFLTYNLSLANNPQCKRALRYLMRKFAVPMLAEEDLAAIGCPVSLIWGRHDKAIKLHIAEQAHQKFGWPLHVIDEARDDPKLERPHEFAAALTNSIKNTIPLAEKSA